MAPGITFDVLPPALAADPNRMDVALFVGFLPLRAGAAAAAARAAVGARLARSGWSARAGAGGDTLTDLPVRVRGIDEVEALFDTGGRLDRTARVRGLGLAPSVDMAEEDLRLTLNLNGIDQTVEIPSGSVDLPALRVMLDTGLDGISVDLDAPDAQGRAALIFSRTAAGAGGLTVYANRSLGIAVAQRDQTRLTGSAMGAALRGFFATGGREAVLVVMGDPIPLFADEAARVAALGRLVGGGFGAGAATFAELAESPVPALPGEYPPRDPWHGLAHLHGLDDAALVLLPDLAELVSNIPAVTAVASSAVRPPERFAVCAAEPASAYASAYDGQSRPGTPAQAGALEMALWSRLTRWAVDETARITPEAMVIAAPPLPAEGISGSTGSVIADLVSNGGGLSHPQLQVSAPWVVTRLASDLPGSACPPDGLVAGVIAGRTLAAGAWRTVSGTALPQVTALLGAQPGLTAGTTPALSLIGRAQRGFFIASDRTTDPGAYGQANIRRLMALVLRAARHRGEVSVFEANGALLWRDVAMSLTTVLRRLYGAGALHGATEEEAFSVVCGPETMHRSDIDAGRVIAEVALRPAHSLETIEISFVARGGALAQRGVAA